jgi:polyhydroxybutyrate depolymerase
MNRPPDIAMMPAYGGMFRPPPRRRVPVAILAIIAVLIALAIHFGIRRWEQRLPPGAVLRTLAFAGEERSYVLYAHGHPPKPALLVMLHGFGGNGAAIERRVRFDAIADREPLVVVYPNAKNATWNDGWPNHSSAPDDVGFLSAVIDSVSSEYGVDAARVYVAGMSNGAAMAYRLSCERPDKIAGVAAVSGGMADVVAAKCTAGRAIRLLAVHGTEDPVIPYGGWLQQNVAHWVKRNGCASAPERSELPDLDPDDGTRTKVERYSSCTDGADVMLYTVVGGGHAWPLREGDGVMGSRGRTPHDFDGADTIWTFFSAGTR